MTTDSTLDLATNASSQALLRLLQLASPALPVGAYSYSEGLETLVQAGQIPDADSLRQWLEQELRYGAVRLEGAIALRAYRCLRDADETGLATWNSWLSALRETEELRQQSWQMGRALVRLLTQIQPEAQPSLLACGEPCNFAVAFTIAAFHWQISAQECLLAYLQSWATNLVSAGIKLIPLGQTAGQLLLLDLYPELEQTVAAIWAMADDELMSCGWGLAIASMNHETLYSRLFRS